MTDNENTITLPEITIEGSPDAQPINESDWWCQGFTTGFNAPNTAAERPLMINDTLAATYLACVESGKKANQEIEADFEERIRDLPQVSPDIGGELYEDVQRRYNEEWEAVFHKHMPHTEVEEEVVRPNIVIITD